MSKHLLKPEPWTVVEDDYTPERNEFLETIFCLGNGYMGVRGTPEEGFSGAGTCPHTYVAAVNDRIPMHPDYHVAAYMPYLTVMVETANWFPLELSLGGRQFDPRAGTVRDYRRTLDLRRGVLTRTLTWEDPAGRATQLVFTRFVSLDNLHLGGIACAVTPLNWRGRIAVTAALDAAHTKNQKDAGGGALGADGAHLVTRTGETKLTTAMAMCIHVRRDGAPAVPAARLERRDRYVARRLNFAAAAGHTYRIEKLAVVCCSRDRKKPSPRTRAARLLATAAATGFEALLARHQAAWERIWHDNDITITGDVAAQQAIRYCIFSMHQSYAGTDPLVNIPAKGLTGPGYGGLYWWDTEAYMVPFFLYTAPEKARTLLLYRYHTLDGARRKAKAYGYDGAMFPWVTITGDECSGDWEYGMLEQHVGAAVTHAIRSYVEATRDEAFLWDCGAEIVIETSRFWASRVTFSARRQKYVINFVTGPDEYAVAVNNNCYTNSMAARNLEFGLEVARRMARAEPAKWATLVQRLGLRDAELAKWRDIVRRMYIPFDRRLGIHEQDDSFLDRDPFDLKTTPADELPVGRKWRWERLMRSQAMKQADVVLLMFMHNDRFPAKVKRANYRFYEPRTTHESSLSPCIYSIMAAELGFAADAFRYYLRSARLDLDDVNGNASQGQHTASIAGSWMSVVNGFGGMRLRAGRLCFEPHLPRRWRKLAFAVVFQGRRIRVEMLPGRTDFLLEGEPLSIGVGQDTVVLRLGRTSVRPQLPARNRAALKRAHSRESLRASGCGPRKTCGGAALDCGDSSPLLY